MTPDNTTGKTPGGPAQSKSAQSKSAQGKSAQGKSAQGKSAQGKSAQGKSAQSKSAQSKSAQSESDQSKPDEESANEQKFGCYFKDGVRRVDYILVWEENLSANSSSSYERQKAAYRHKFEDNLVSSGVEIEREASVSTKKKIHYVKLFVTWSTMCHYAEYLGFRAPLEMINTPSSNLWSSSKSRSTMTFTSPLDQQVPNKPMKFYTCAFSTAKLGTYIGSSDQDTYFKPIQRFEVAFEILGTQVYGRKELSQVGLNRMLKEGIYSCAFPPHEGSDTIPTKASARRLNSRQILHNYWARWNLWYKFQPLDHIREYFGEKIAFYFAFLGYYTTWLVPVSIMGIVVCVYSFFILEDSQIVKESCNSGKSFKMCPLCWNEQICNYWHMSEICNYIKAAYAFDNDSTVFFSVFVSLWACAFLESWKRNAAAIAYQWDVIDFIDVQERPRPEYSAKCKEYTEDPVTGSMEPHFPFSKRLPRLVVGVISMIIMMIMSVFCLIIMIHSRTKILQIQFGDELFRSRALTIANAVSAVLNLVLVLLLELLYESMAVSITEWEMHRTQTQFENKLIIKVFIFELFNHYLSIGYTALIKGSFSSRPGQQMPFATCVNGSCMFEVTQILAIITVGKQLAVNLLEFLLPKLFTCLHQCVLGLKTDTKSNKQWEADYMLIPYDQGLFMEYLEVILQFAFITLFVPAFPLAPLFALLNNLVEIRLDARKLVCGTRRPLPERSQDIGVWFSMLQFIVHLSTLSNALLMAFTSEFLPTLLYRITHNSDLKGYKNFTLSWAPYNTTSQPCQYSSIGSISGYSELFWKLLSMRLLFVLSYQQIVVTLSSLIGRMIPDMPTELALKIKRQKYLAKQAALVDAGMQTSRRARVFSPAFD